MGGPGWGDAQGVRTTCLVVGCGVLPAAWRCVPGVLRAAGQEPRGSVLASPCTRPVRLLAGPPAGGSVSSCGEANAPSLASVSSEPALGGRCPS